MTNEELINQCKKEIAELTSQIDKSKINYNLPMGSWVSYKESEISDRERITIAERNNKLKHFIICLKCEASGKCCDDNCPTQYEAGIMGEIIENLEAISKALEQEPKTGHWIDTHNIDAKYKAIYMCSNCRSCYTEMKPINMNFCPNCGAKMVEPQESEDKK